MPGELTLEQCKMIQKKLEKTEKEIQSLAVDYFADCQYITNVGPTANLYAMIQLQDQLVKELADATRAAKKGGTK